MLLISSASESPAPYLGLFLYLGVSSSVPGGVPMLSGVSVTLACKPAHGVYHNQCCLDFFLFFLNKRVKKRQQQNQTTTTKNQTKEALQTKVTEGAWEQLWLPRRDFLRGLFRKPLEAFLRSSPMCAVARAFCAPGGGGGDGARPRGMEPGPGDGARPGGACAGGAAARAGREWRPGPAAEPQVRVGRRAGPCRGPAAPPGMGQALPGTAGGGARSPARSPRGSRRSPARYEPRGPAQAKGSGREEPAEFQGLSGQC